MGLDVCVSAIRPELDPDGSVPRFGLLALSSDLTSEGDIRRLLPGDAALHVSRVGFDNPTTPETLAGLAPRLAEAAELITPGVPLRALLFSCTSGSVVIGDGAVAAAMGKGRPETPVVTPVAAAMEALSALGAQRIALLTPYLPETTRPMAAYFTERGLSLVAAECLGLADDREMARVTPRTILDAAAAADRPEAEALFISCTALPALGQIDEIEARLGKPVVTSNQASAWLMLRHAGLAPAPGAPGQLFAAAPTVIEA